MCQAYIIQSYSNSRWNNIYFAFLQLHTKKTLINAQKIIYILLGVEPLDFYISGKLTKYTRFCALAPILARSTARNSSLTSNLQSIGKNVFASYIKAEPSLYNSILLQQQGELQQTQDRATTHSKDTGNNNSPKPTKLYYALNCQSNTTTSINLYAQKRSQHKKVKSYKNNNLIVYTFFFSCNHCHH